MIVGGIIPPVDEKKLISIGVKEVFTPKDFKIEDIMKNLVSIIKILWLKKKLDLVIELTKELYKIDISSYIPIKYRKLDIGWIHKRNNKILKFLKKENDFIDLKKSKNF